ncbi:MAG: disulfide bond formation protein B [Moraxellaceae bacterium]|nr:disulfide bond formation protein B [Moraxellaceae bacterium]
MTLPSPRLTNFGLFVLMLVGMGVALYLQHYAHLEPCPLCVFQRVSLMSMGIVALIAFIHNPAALGRRIYAGLSLVGALAGVGVAGRHVWLQHLPADEVPSCGPGLDYWMDTFPFQEVVQKVLRGSGECAKVDWMMFGLSLPEWTLMLFVGLTSVVVWQLVRKA